MKHRIKIKKGIAGLVAGLIAAIALLVIALPVMMQYQQHITKSYQIEEYATMLEEQKELEEKGLASCYEPSEKIISINNTLGRPVRIVMAYATDGENEEVKYYQPAIEIAPGVNILHVINNLSITTLNPSEIKTIKLITSRGTIIQPPYCREIVEITYKKAVEEIVKKGFPVNLYLGEEQIPGGLQAFIGLIYAHGFIDYKTNDTLNFIFINGTTVPRPTSNLAFLISIDLIGFSILRYEAGDYLVVAYSPIPSIDTDNYGCYGTSCYSFGNVDFEAVLYRFAYSYVSKYADDDAPHPVIDPLNYTLINSGYDYIVVGAETSDFYPQNYFSSNVFYYNGTIYISRRKISNPQDADIIAKFFVRHERSDSQWDITIENATLYINGNKQNILAFYRVNYRYWSVPLHVDQFVIYVPVEKLLNVKAGDDIWVYVETSFYTNSEKYYDNSGDWIKYTYTPTKEVVDTWYKQYFGS